MFSRLEPLFLRQFRQAETTDTRQAIREEHKDESRSKNERDTQTQDEQDLWTDTTVVSIESLHAFLVNFLREQIDMETQNSADATPHTELGSNVPASPGGKAASAYEATARRYEHPPMEDADAAPRNTGAIESEDVRLINHLIRQLQDLSKRGITELTIPRAGTFLESLRQAIENA